MNQPEMNTVNSVYRSIVGGGENIAHLLAVLDLSYSHFLLDIHEAYVNLEDDTVDFYIDEPVFGISLDDVLVVPPDDTEASGIPGLIVVKYNIPERSLDTLQGFVKLHDEQLPDGYLSPENRYHKASDEVKTVNPYEMQKKMRAQIETLKEGAQNIQAMEKMADALPEGGRKLPDDVANAVLPSTLVQNINDEIEKMKPSSKIIT